MNDEEILEYFKARWDKKYSKISMTLSDEEILKIALDSYTISSMVEKAKHKILKDK